MPDKRVTDEITAENDSSDARSAEEFLFGHAGEEAAHEAAADEVAEEEHSLGDPEVEAGQDSLDSNQAGNEIAPVEELKIVVSIRDTGPPSGCSSPRRTRTSSPSTAWSWPHWRRRSRRWPGGPGPDGWRNLCTRPTRGPLLQLGGSTNSGRNRLRLQRRGEEADQQQPETLRLF